VARGLRLAPTASSSAQQEDRMKRWIRIGTTVVVGSVAAASTVTADSITITADHRNTIVLAQVTEASGLDRHTDSDGPGDALTSDANASSGTSSGSSTASLSSSIADPSHWSGTGAADVSWTTQDAADFSSDSAFAVDFTLSAPMSYVFGSSFDGTFAGTGVADAAQSRWAATLTRLGSGTFAFNDSAINTTGSRLFVGQLLAGTYRLLVDGSSVGNTRAGGGSGTGHLGFDFTFDLTPAQTEPPAPTPEPASLLLFGTGALATLRAARRRAAR
jgi:hypothetical protein